jgi:hypothetical protein
MEETLSVTSSAVGEASTAWVMVGAMLSTVEVGVVVAGMAGTGVFVDSVTGAGVDVQALRIKKMAMTFLMMKHYMSMQSFSLSILLQPCPLTGLFLALISPLRRNYGVAPTKLNAYRASS